MTKLIEAGDPLKQFRDNVTGRIKGEIAGLLPDDVLAQMTQDALASMFKERGQVNRGSVHYPRYEEEARNWFENLVYETTQPLVKEKVRAILAGMDDEIRAHVAEQLDREKLLIAAAPVIGAAVRDAIAGVGFDIVNSLRSQGVLR